MEKSPKNNKSSSTENTIFFKACHSLKVYLIKVLQMINPINLILIALILFFIVIRVLSINENTQSIAIEKTNSDLKSDFKSEHKSDLKSDLKSEVKNETKNEVSSKPDNLTKESTSTEMQTTQSTEISNVSNQNEIKAYSRETNKYYTLSEFCSLDKTSLMTFSGIGEVTAQAILDYIQAHGNLKNFEELMEIKGIGEKKLQKILNP